MLNFDSSRIQNQMSIAFFSFYYSWNLGFHSWWYGIEMEIWIMAIMLWIMHCFYVILLCYFKQKCGLTNLHLICKHIQIREKRAEFVLLKCTFVRRASEFLRNYFPSLIDSMLNDKGNFSQVNLASIAVILKCRIKSGSL